MLADPIAQTLREMVIDENKIVTYRTLSRVCALHVNQAKKSLEDFFNSEEGLNVTYFLSGYVNEEANNTQNNGYSVTVVPESKLEEVKARFKQLDSCHVYSIQKAIIKDSSVLYTANYDQIPSDKERPKPVIRNLALSNIRPTAVKKTSNESQKTVTAGLVQAKPASSNNTGPQDDVESSKTKSKTTETKPAANSKTPKTNGIMAAFMRGQTNGKKVSPPQIKQETPAQTKTSQKKNSKSNGVKLSEESFKKKTKSLPTTKELKEAKKQMWSESSSDEEVAPPSKRSRTLNRIKQLPESDSEDEKDINTETTTSQDSEEPIPREIKKEHSISEDDDEDVIPPTPEENKTARQYVAVKNTYLDDDGFLVTRKERKLEEVQLSKPSPVKTKSKSSPPTTTSNNNTRGKGKRSRTASDDKRKQPSLMSFFTKK